MALYEHLDWLLEPLMAAVRHVEQLLGPDDDWVKDDRRILYEYAERLVGETHPLFHEKGEAEYITTVRCAPEQFEAAIMPPYQRNLASSRKYRTHHAGGKQFAVGSYVIDGLSRPPRSSTSMLVRSMGGKRDRSMSRRNLLGVATAMILRALTFGLYGNRDDDPPYREQHHIFAFKGKADGTTDVYGHRETSVREGAEHLTNAKQQDGVPYNLFGILDRAGVEYHHRF